MTAAKDDIEVETTRSSIGGLMGVVIVAFLPLTMMAHKGVAPLFILAVLGVAYISFRHGRLKWQPRLLESIIGACIFLAFMSAAWSITPGVTIQTAVSFSATLAGGAFLFRNMESLQKDGNQRFSEYIIFGGAVGYLFLGFELLTGAQTTVFILENFGRTIPKTDNPLSLLNSASSVGSILVWIWILALARRFTWRVNLPLAVMAVGVLLLSEAAAPQLAMVIGLVVFSAAIFKPKIAFNLFFIVVAAAALLAPLIAAKLPNPTAKNNKVEFISNSAAHRLVIWRNTASHIIDSPILGLGFDTSRALYSRMDRETVEINPGSRTNNWNGTFEPIPLHPHNGVLQIWLEFGVFGIAIFLTLLYVMFQGIARSASDPFGKAICLGAVACALTIFSLSFGAWQSWWLAALFLLASCAIGIPPKILLSSISARQTS